MTANQGKVLNDKITATDAKVDTKANQATAITAGNGLTGGGTLQDNRTLTLGTPSQITASTTNSVIATSHTHAIDKASTTTQGIVQLNDTLVSNATDQALTAKQGKVLNDKINSLSVGGRNLLKNSSPNFTSTNYMHRFELTNAPSVGDDVVITLWGELGTDPYEDFQENWNTKHSSGVTRELMRELNGGAYTRYVDNNFCGPDGYPLECIKDLLARAGKASCTLSEQLDFIDTKRGVYCCREHVERRYFASASRFYSTGAGTTGA